MKFTPLLILFTFLVIGLVNAQFNVVVTQSGLAKTNAQTQNYVFTSALTPQAQSSISSTTYVTTNNAPTAPQNNTNTTPAPVATSPASSSGGGGGGGGSSGSSSTSSSTQTKTLPSEVKQNSNTENDSTSIPQANPVQNDEVSSPITGRVVESNSGATIGIVMAVALAVIAALYFAYKKRFN